MSMDGPGAVKVGTAVYLASSAAAAATPPPPVLLELLAAVLAAEPVEPEDDLLLAHADVATSVLMQAMASRASGARRRVRPSINACTDMCASAVSARDSVVGSIPNGNDPTVSQYDQRGNPLPVNIGLPLAPYVSKMFRLIAKGTDQR